LCSGALASVSESPSPRSCLHLSLRDVPASGPTMTMTSDPGICEKKKDFVLKMHKRFPPTFWTTLPAPPAMGAPITELSTWMTNCSLHLNKGELENLHKHFPGSAPGSVDIGAFVFLCSDGSAGRDPVWVEHTGVDPNTAHLALSGVAHLEFGEQRKPFPAHWGTAPNAQMKGHSGIVRELPGGYGKGNEPMAKWVAENMKKDKESMTTVRGVKPYPLGNYSL